MAPIDIIVNQVAYENRPRVKQDVQHLISEVRTLQPKIGGLVSNNGLSSNLLVLSGTIPILYKGVTYNIPVELFIPLRYPVEPPKFFVRPTPNMTVKNNHKHVDLQGVIYLPYLNEWNISSNLLGLVEIASSVFSIEPPLFSKPPGYSNNTSQSTSGNIRPMNTNSAYNPAVALTPTPTASNSNTPAIVASVYQASNDANVVSSGYAGSSSNPVPLASASSTSIKYNEINSGKNYQNNGSSQKVFSNSYGNNVNLMDFSDPDAAIEHLQKRTKLIEDVRLKIHSALMKRSNELRDELDVEFKNSNYLNNSMESLKTNENEINDTTREIQTTLNNMEQRFQELQVFDENEAKKEKIDVEDRVIPYDKVSEQITKLTAELNAIDDAFYLLERALVSSLNDTMDLRTFLRESRKLARQQFLSRVHLKKIQHILVDNERLQAERNQTSNSNKYLSSQISSQQQYQNHQPNNFNQAYPELQSGNVDLMSFSPLPPHQINTQNSQNYYNQSAATYPSI